MPHDPWPRNYHQQGKEYDHHPFHNSTPSQPGLSTTSPSCSGLFIIVHHCSGVVHHCSTTIRACSSLFGAVRDCSRHFHHSSRTYGGLSRIFPSYPWFDHFLDDPLVMTFSFIYRFKRSGELSGLLEDCSGMFGLVRETFEDFHPFDHDLTIPNHDFSLIYRFNCSISLMWLFAVSCAPNGGLSCDPDKKTAHHTTTNGMLSNDPYQNIQESHPCFPEERICSPFFFIRSISLRNFLLFPKT